MVCRAPPRLFSSVTLAPWAAGSTATRKATGEESRAASRGRNNTPSVAPRSAARCNRRICRGSALRSQASAISQAPERSACSKAQSADFPSLPRLAFPGSETRLRWLERSRQPCTTSMRSNTTPHSASAGAKGCRGGATHAHQRASGRCVTAARTGNRSDSSPAPKQVGRISISPACGQPPPGRHSSRIGKPVGSVRIRAALRPRQMAGCSSRRESSRDMAGPGHYMRPCVFPRRSTPTTMPSMSSGCSLRSTLMGSKSLFSGSSQTTEPS